MGYYDDEEDLSEPIEVGLARPLILSESGKAIRFAIEGQGNVWVPKGAIHDDSEVWKLDQPEGKLIVKRWLALQKGWCE